MKCCPLKECGRKFQNEETMLEHVKRRHPTQYDAIRGDITKSLLENEHAQQQQLNKLPKLQKIMSREKKALEIHRRSASKGIKPGDSSLIIQQSRQIVNTSGIAARRPSLKNKLSEKELKTQKLPSISIKSHKKSAVLLPIDQPQPQVQRKTSNFDKEDNSKAFYTTAPNFNRPSLKVKSKEKIKSRESIDKISQSIVEQKTQRKQVQLQGEKKNSLGLFRPMKKLSERKHQSRQKSRSNEEGGDEQVKAKYDAYNFDERVVVIKNWESNRFECPPKARVENLFINHCGLTKIMLNELSSLIELSLTHNSLTNTDFLKYSRNGNIKSLHLDYNLISDLFVPPRVKVLTASFNKLEAQNLQVLCESLERAPDLQEIDLSFNSVRKGSNYKIKLLIGNFKLKSIDGLKVTKIDIEMMEQYKKIEAEERGLIPLANQFKDRPTTAATAANSQVAEDSRKIDELEKQCLEYEKNIKSTQQQFSIIEQENQIISSELKALDESVKELQLDEGTLGLYTKLQKQVECLELLNFLAYADEEELVAMVTKKRGELAL